VAVVVNEGTKHALEVAPAGDPEPVDALRADGTDEALNARNATYPGAALGVPAAPRGRLERLDLEHPIRRLVEDVAIRSVNSGGRDDLGRRKVAGSRIRKVACGGSE
jgi:hypothetical protein